MTDHRAVGEGKAWVWFRQGEATAHTLVSLSTVPGPRPSTPFLPISLSLSPHPSPKDCWFSGRVVPSCQVICPELPCPGKLGFIGDS